MFPRACVPRVKQSDRSAGSETDDHLPTEIVYLAAVLEYKLVLDNFSNTRAACLRHTANLQNVFVRRNFEIDETVKRGKTGGCREEEIVVAAVPKLAREERRTARRKRKHVCFEIVETCLVRDSARYFYTVRDSDSKGDFLRKRGGIHKPADRLVYFKCSSKVL